MKTLNYKAIVGATILMIVIGILGVLWQKPRPVVGSVAVGNQYQSTTTPYVADLTNLCPVRSGSTVSTGILGSIVYTGPNVGSLHVYDATTTSAALRAIAATTTLLLAEIPALVTGNATTSPQTFTYDIEFKRGLLIDMVGSAPTTTITYRCEG